VIDIKLREQSRLFATHDIVQLLRSWRHKTPVIYRAAAQWFICMDAETPGTQGVSPVTKPRKPCASWLLSSHRRHPLLT
jgi:isoleucyl-tRNA synthetase